MSDEPIPNRRDNLLWGLISAALLSGAGSGVLTVTQTQDRYYATDAQRDFELRDERISSIRRRLSEIEEDVKRIDRNGPAVGNQQLRELIADFEGRLDDLERQK